jgi:hypothetical protein
LKKLFTNMIDRTVFGDLQLLSKKGLVNIVGGPITDGVKRLF